MKNNFTCLCLISYSVCAFGIIAPTTTAIAEKNRPAGGPAGIPGGQAISEALKLPIYSPQPGQVSTSPDDLLKILSALTAVADTVQAGTEGQASPWFAKTQSVRTKLTRLVASKLQADLFSMVPELAEFITADSNVPEFVHQSAALLHALDKEMIVSIERYITEHNGLISASNLAVFIEVFSKTGFVNEPDWEDQPIPVDSAGILILDPAAVVTHLKMRPWQEAGQFLGDASAAQAFTRYAAAGDGMAILKTKYAANQAAITAKWEELAAWVETQRPRE